MTNANTTRVYDEDSIKSLGILGGVRAKPASIGLENHNHTFLEILGNSIDEHNAGYGKSIVITKNHDGSVTIRDFGRGVPMDKNAKGEYSYRKVFSELWSGGKYDNNEDGDTDYQYSLGTNGVGATGSNYTSDFFHVISYSSNGKDYSVEFEKGVESEEGLKIVKGGKREVGTEITWLPSKEVFRGKGEIDNEFIIETLKDQAIVNGGLKFIFNYDGESEEYYYENGVSDFIDSISNDTGLNSVVNFSNEQRGKDNESDKDYKIKVDLYFSFNREVSYKRLYHNSSWLENGGTPDDFIRNSFAFSIDKAIREKGLYNKNEKKITPEDVLDSLIVVSSTYSTISLFSDQTKKKISSDFMRTEITKWLRDEIAIYLVENPNEADLIYRQVLVNKRSRERAESTRLDVKKKLQGTVNNITGRVDGFINCRSKDNTETELYIVEGKSALGSTKQGRDANIQGIYALRGKILNCLKADHDRIFKSDIIVDLIKILGCGVEIKSKHNKELNTFDIEKLKWSKVVITTDSDIDGQHIRTLVLTMIYRLMPSLITEGKVFIAESPLYEIENNGKTFFAHTDDEKDELVKGMTGNILIQRSKGLGENTAEMMWETTMNPETRKLIRVNMEDNVEVSDAFELFLGDNLTGRKEFIEEHLHEYIEESLD